MIRVNLLPQCAPSRRSKHGDATRTCEACGVTWLIRDKPTSKRFCSLACRKTIFCESLSPACRHCGKTFRPKANNRVTYCSRECAYAERKRLVSVHAEERRAAAEAARVARVERTCLACGEIWMVHPKSLAQVCSPKCRVERDRQVALASARAKRPDRPDRSPRPCRQCGAAFLPRYVAQVYCGRECSARHARGMERARYGQSARHRAHVAGVEYELVRRGRVFERDRYTCQICGGAAPAHLAGTNDPQAPTLDHKIPIARGGPHTYLNVQCAHRQCNALKSDRLYGTLG